MDYGPVSPIFWLTHTSRPAHLFSFYSLIFLPLFRVLVSWWSLFRPSLILPFLNISGITVHLVFASVAVVAARFVHREHFEHREVVSTRILGFLK